MGTWYNENRFLKRLQQFSQIDRQGLENIDSAAYSADYTLWNMLQKGQLNGYKFERQKRLFGTTVEFYCKEARLAIDQEQVDHEMRRLEERVSDEILHKAGIKVLRFHRDMILQRPAIVKNAILEELSHVKQDGPAN